MNTLTSPRITTLLDRLFSEATTADAPIRERLGQLSPAARADFLGRAQHDYRGFYGEAKDLFLPVSRETGRMLYVLARASRARNVVEYGTSFGLSTIHLAAAVRDNGGGHVVGTEFEPGKVARARAHLEEAGLSDLVEIREGDALETLGRDLPGAIDLVLLDGAKVLYPKILAVLEPRLVPSAIVVADNADDSPTYLARVRDAKSGYVSVPFADDVEVSVRVA
jgi:predicted O-methyltransferase YrrM